MSEVTVMRDWSTARAWLYREIVPSLAMNPERWKQIDDLLQSALRPTPDRRAEFLHGACAGDTALEQEVRSLVSSAQKAEKFLRRPAIVVAGKAAATLQDDSRLDRSSASLDGKPFRTTEDRQAGRWRHGSGLQGRRHSPCVVSSR